MSSVWVFLLTEGDVDSTVVRKKTAIVVGIWKKCNKRANVVD